MKKRPESVSECQFKDLLIYWKSEKFQKMSKINTENRKKLMDLHTTGKKSFTLIRNKLVEGGTLSLKEIFSDTRVRKLCRTYKASNESTTSKIAEIKENEMQLCANDQSVDAFSAVMGAEHPGRLTL
ncbi:putative cell number regulator 2-like [Capsicum annuum]|nr:putative cell number regulator 2-like [Capsicum annuum]